MTTVFKAAAIIALAFTGAACATDPATDVQNLVENGEEMECRRVAETGSRLGTKTCATKAEWAKNEEEEAREAREVSNRLRERTRDMTSDIGM